MTLPVEKLPPAEKAWRARGSRLHPLTPVVRAGRVLVSLAALAAYNLESVKHAGWWAPVVVVGALVLGFGAGVASWAFTRFRIDGGEVRIDSGVFIRRSRQVRIDRLQAIDIVQPLLARAFGLAELKLDMAGGAEGRVRLGYLRLEEAQALRASLLAMAAGLDHRTPEAPQQALLHCSGGAIVGSALLSTQAFIGFIWVGGFLTGAVHVRPAGRVHRRAARGYQRLPNCVADDPATLRIHCR